MEKKLFFLEWKNGFLQINSRVKKVVKQNLCFKKTEMSNKLTWKESV